MKKNFRLYIALIGFWTLFLAPPALAQQSSFYQAVIFQRSTGVFSDVFECTPAGSYFGMVSDHIFYSGNYSTKEGAMNASINSLSNCLNSLGYGSGIGNGRAICGTLTNPGGWFSGDTALRYKCEMTYGSSYYSGYDREIYWPNPNAWAYSAPAEWVRMETAQGNNSLSISKNTGYTPTFREVKADLKANGSDSPRISGGENVNLSWSATGGIGSCTASGDWFGSRQSVGSETVANVTTEKNFEIHCRFAGIEVSDSVRVVVTPRVDLKIVDASGNELDGPVVVPNGGNLLLSWTTIGADSCTASGNWSGPKDLNGSLAVRAPDALTMSYVLTCFNEAGSVSDQVNADFFHLNLLVNRSDGPITIGNGGSVNLEWRLSRSNQFGDANDYRGIRCLGSGDWSGEKSVPSGSETVGPLSGPSTKNLILACQNNFGSFSDRTEVNVGQVFSAVDLKIEGQDGPISAKPLDASGRWPVYQVSWLASGAIRCTANSQPPFSVFGWSGNKTAPQGLQNSSWNFTTDTRLILNCTDGLNTLSDSVEVKPDYFRILAPNGGESLEIGKDFGIRWQSASFLQNNNVNLYLVCAEEPCPPGAVNYGLPALYPISVSTPNDGSFVWRVGSMAGGVNLSTGRYLARVATYIGLTQRYDDSDSNFNVVPTGGSRYACNASGACVVDPFGPFPSLTNCQALCVPPSPPPPPPPPCPIYVPPICGPNQKIVSSGQDANSCYLPGQCVSISSPPPLPPPPPPPSLPPTVDLKVNGSDSRIESSSPATLSWTSSNADSCTASGGGWLGVKSPSGSQSVGPFHSGTLYVYILSCTGGGQTVSDRVEVMGAAPPPPPPPPPPLPTVDLKINGSDALITVNYNTSATLSWTSLNATSCIASQWWSGAKPLNGSESTGLLTESKTYRLSCTGAGGTSADSVAVSVSSPPPPPTPPPPPSSPPAGEVTPPPPPAGGGVTPPPPPPSSVLTVDLKVNGSDGRIESSAPATLFWTTANVTQCTASGPNWSGNKPLPSGSESVGPFNPNTLSTFTLSCIGVGQTVSDRVQVFGVASPSPPPPPPSAGYSCVNNACVAVSSGAEFANLSGCQSACEVTSPPPPPPSSSCNNNGVCNIGETHTSCPSDCKVEIDIGEEAPQ